MKEVLIDTDTFSLFLRKQPKVMSAASDYLSIHRGFTFSVITHFEILRGLIAKGAEKQIIKFGLIRAEGKELNLTNSVIERASDIYATHTIEGKLSVMPTS